MGGLCASREPIRDNAASWLPHSSLSAGSKGTSGGGVVTLRCQQTIKPNNSGPVQSVSRDIATSRHRCWSKVETSKRTTMMTRTARSAPESSRQWRCARVYLFSRDKPISSSRIESEEDNLSDFSSKTLENIFLNSFKHREERENAKFLSSLRRRMWTRRSKHLWIFLRE